VDENLNPVKEAVITISGEKQNIDELLWTDSRGYFKLCGLPFGRYVLAVEALGYKRLEKEIIFLEPLTELYFKITLIPHENLKSSSNCLLDFTALATQTTISESQMEHLPSGNSVWSLIENQDLSATTNRIDVGGLWASVPALFSSRGGCSWTQNVYGVNGFNVTDPFWTGMPLILPDVYGLQFITHGNSSHPVQAFSPGASFDLIPKEGGPEYHGGFSSFFITKKMKSSNITPALEKEGIKETDTFNHLADVNLHFSGPLVRQKLFLFTSWTTNLVSRDLADYEKEDRSALYSGLVHLNYLLPRNFLHFFWTGQFVSHLSYGAGRNIPFVSTSQKKNLYQLFQAFLDSKPKENSAYRLGLSFCLGNFHSDFQDNVSSQHGLEVFSKIPSGPAPFASRDSRRILVFSFHGKNIFMNSPKSRHLLQYGLDLQSSTSSSKQEIHDNLHLHFFNKKPLEVVLYNTPLQHRESSFHLNLFAQETMTLANNISVFLGLNLNFSQGWILDKNSYSSPVQSWNEISKEKNKIWWLNLSPRASLRLPLSQKRTSFFTISLARYYFTLPLNYLTYGNPDALGGLVYEWEDLNTDGFYQKGEEKTLLRRQGPFFSKVDLSLKRPFTDELAISFIHHLGSNWFLTLAGFWRETKNLIETENIGVPFSDYEPVLYYDKGDDQMPVTWDDLIFTVYDQKRETFGNDFFLLTNPEAKTRVSRYKGMDVTLIKKYSSKFIFFFTFTATRAEGTTNPGNTEWENDDGVIGSLYDNPNTLINARGRMRFDRAYTARIGLSFQAPWGIRMGCLIKYYDGQPFARKIIIEGLNQGPFYIQAHPRGVSRYEFNMTMDIRIEKVFTWGKGKLRIILDGFNILNQNLATEENEWTGPEYPYRYATDIQSPRVFRIGLNYEF